MFFGGPEGDAWGGGVGLRGKAAAVRFWGGRALQPALPRHGANRSMEKKLPACVCCRRVGHVGWHARACALHAQARKLLCRLMRVCLIVCPRARTKLDARGKCAHVHAHGARSFAFASAHACSRMSECACMPCVRVLMRMGVFVCVCIRVRVHSWLHPWVTLHACCAFVFPHECVQPVACMRSCICSGAIACNRAHACVHASAQVPLHANQWFVRACMCQAVRAWTHVHTLPARCCLLGSVSTWLCLQTAAVNSCLCLPHHFARLSPAAAAGAMAARTAHPCTFGPVANPFAAPAWLLRMAMAARRRRRAGSSPSSGPPRPSVSPNVSPRREPRARGARRRSAETRPPLEWLAAQGDNVDERARVAFRRLNPEVQAEVAAAGPVQRSKQLIGRITKVMRENPGLNMGCAGSPWGRGPRGRKRGRVTEEQPRAPAEGRRPRLRLQPRPPAHPPAHPPPEGEGSREGQPDARAESESPPPSEVKEEADYDRDESNGEEEGQSAGKQTARTLASTSASLLGDSVQFDVNDFADRDASAVHSAVPRIRIITLGLDRAGCTAAMRQAASRAGHRARFHDDQILLAVNEILGEQGLRRITGGLPPAVFDARGFRPPYRDGRLAVKDRSLMHHCGWHRGYVEQAVKDYPGEWKTFLEEAKRRCWGVSEEAVRDDGGFTVIIYCNAGVTRSVALSRVLALLMLVHLMPGCAEGCRVSVWHLTTLTPATSPWQPSCGGMCSECRQGLPEVLTSRICREFVLI